jgi:hypothetical protein
MKKITYVFAVLLLSVTACKKNQQDAVVVQNPSAAIAQQNLDDAIKDQVIKTGHFDWISATDEMLWSALQYGDDVVSIGFKPANTSSDLSSSIHNINISQGAWASTKQSVLQSIYQQELQLQPNLLFKNLEAYEENVLPVVNVHIKSLSTIKFLRSLNTVRYVEPMGYEPQSFVETLSSSGIQTSSGCGANVADNGLMNGTDYAVISPNAKQSWHHAYHNISGAWTKSSGAGIKILIIDSGIGQDQTLFGSNFNSGFSTGRTIEKAVTLRKSAWFGFGYGGAETSTADECGHGTQMAGLCAAPLSSFGNAAGVAYNCNLVTVRASTDVLIDESRETKGVADAFVLAGNKSDVRIVSMSMGRITGSSQISDAIDYAYNNNKLIFCAAGTSFGWSAGWFGVIFPATKWNVNAVTGVTDNNNRCVDCHDGQEEKASNQRHALTTDMNSYTPSTAGGSSAATATMAGIAALVWAKNPAFTRDEVINKLIQNCSNYPNNKSNSLGWGNVDANGATN